MMCNYGYDVYMYVCVYIYTHYIYTYIYIFGHHPLTYPTKVCTSETRQLNFDRCPRFPITSVRANHVGPSETVCIPPENGNLMRKNHDKALDLDKPT